MEMAGDVGSLESREPHTIRRRWPGIQAVHMGFNRSSSTPSHPAAPHTDLIKGGCWYLKRPGLAGSDRGSLKVSRASEVLGGGLLSCNGSDLVEAAGSPAGGLGSDAEQHFNEGPKVRGNPCQPEGKGLLFGGPQVPCTR